jgi:hypothetical protein
MGGECWQVVSVDLAAEWATHALFVPSLSMQTTKSAISGNFAMIQVRVCLAW